MFCIYINTYVYKNQQKIYILSVFVKLFRRIVKLSSIDCKVNISTIACIDLLKSP